MSPEPFPDESSRAPAEAPTVALDAPPAMAGNDSTTIASATLPDPAAPSSPLAPAPAITADETLANASELSPAASLSNASELSPAACGARLVELFPALFAAPGGPGPVKPIKLRIHADIQARAPGQFSKRILGVFFSRHTTSNAYLKALTLAPHRFDLDGQPAGEISDEHRRLAAEELARRHALAAERRAAQRPPQRDRPAAEGSKPTDTGREPRPDRRPGPRPEGPPGPPDQGPDRRPGHRPVARPTPRPPGSAQRFQRPVQPGREQPVSARDARPARPLCVADGAAPPAAARQPQPERAPLSPRRESAAPLPLDAEQRERALLLRNFESSPLSKANFCALKGLTEAALDATLAQAQAERGLASTARPGVGSGRGR